ncbi:MAG: hypothetical protein ACP5FK_11515 [bacterium]
MSENQHEHHHCHGNQHHQTAKCCCLENPAEQRDLEHMKECVKMLREKADMIEKNLSS